MFKFLVGSFLVVCSFLLAESTPYATSLSELQERVAFDLNSINYPEQAWLPELEGVLDVVIVGGGQSGLAAAFSLQKLGIRNVKILDEAPEGFEGPWATYARMKVLRSDKYNLGPSCSVPSLTFCSWYHAQFGAEAWYQLWSIPTHQWMEYLRWYRKVLDLPIENNVKIVSIVPTGDLLRVECQQNGLPLSYLARKVVLATGRMGFGGAEMPKWLVNVPKTLYAHTVEDINFSSLAGKRVAVLGAGASAMDAAAVALEHGAESVHLLLRAASIPNVSGFGVVSSNAWLHGHYRLNDEQKWNILSFATEHGVPPPPEALQRLKAHSNIHLHANFNIRAAQVLGDKLQIVANQEELSCDYLILGCGFDIDGSKTPELAGFADEILLWRDRLDPGLCSECPKLGRAAYLGPSFEFCERNSGKAPYLKNIYCFNYGALVSHSLASGDIDGVAIGAARLAEGIATDFFVSNMPYFEKQMRDFDEKVFEDEDASFL
ncbi:MAG: NAD(P)/FAD-dependent oxidoreductase [Chlamydiales bacterium]|nr:NAD(P)/FAD-dependent oxidoreductase [Chlamydiales bacterium]